MLAPLLNRHHVPKLTHSMDCELLSLQRRRHARHHEGPRRIRRLSCSKQQCTIRSYHRFSQLQQRSFPTRTLLSRILKATRLKLHASYFNSTPLVMNLHSTPPYSAQHEVPSAKSEDHVSTCAPHVLHAHPRPPPRH